MFTSLKIGQRLALLIVAFALGLAATATIALVGFDSVTRKTQQLNLLVDEGSKLGYVQSIVTNEFIDTANNLHRGAITWDSAKSKVDLAFARFDAAWNNYYGALDVDTREFVDDVFGLPVERLREAMQTFLTIAEQQSRGRLDLFMLNDMPELANPFVNALQASIAQESLLAAEAFKEATQVNGLMFNITIVVVILAAVVAATLGVVVYRSITRPIGSMNSAVRAISAGDYTARTELTGRDELAQFGTAFDNLLNERIEALARAEVENEKLNESVIGLLEALERLSNRDLTVQLPVTEDVIGPVADAMNVMTSEILQVLKDIRDVAGEVDLASNQVSEQGAQVSAVAAKERKLVEYTAVRLSDMVNSMNEIAELANSGNTAAAKASQNTDMALSTVTQTVEGMNEIREIISETEKRIKRLGERSQEITAIVEMINNIAERTHVLALNASMQAAAAGEAGRGFAVVADEVQRLAEGSRNSTSQIATLVKNIQTETAETMATMNRTIEQVVAGSELAERAGVQMRDTQTTTAELVAAVIEIARQSGEQAEAGGKLREYAGAIKKSTAQTNVQIAEQTQNTERLTEFAKRLTDAVAVFTLERARSESKAA